jgi:5-methylthioribose kinase
VCAKRALPKLRVAADWRAPIERNLYEARWMQVAEAAVPGSAPRMLGQHPGLGVLVMSWLPPAEHRLWKTLLRDGHAEAATAQAVGRTLVRIHAFSAPVRSSRRSSTATPSSSTSGSSPICWPPRAAPDLAPALQALVAQTQAHKRALVHGDVSPKNILVGPQGPVLLDAECAWWGDPAFDLAFCLNHLLLKCLWPRRRAASWPASTPGRGLPRGRGLGAARALEQRAAALLPGCCWRASTASRRWSTSARTPGARPCAAARAPCCSNP